MEGRSRSTGTWILTAAALLIAVGVSVFFIVSGEAGVEEVTVAGVEGCEEVAEPQPRPLDLDPPGPDARLDPQDEPVAVMQTTCGTFEIALDAERAPRTTSSFAHLVRAGAFDGTHFHRIAPSFVIQGGDPLGDGTGGPGYSVDEPPPDDLVYARGVVAMAKTPAEPPGRSGSQFFIVTAPADAGLPPEYALVGRVVEGEDVVDRIAELGGPDEEPTHTVVLESATIELRG